MATVRGSSQSVPKEKPFLPVSRKVVEQTVRPMLQFSKVIFKTSLSFLFVFLIKKEFNEIKVKKLMCPLLH
ncbi:hypothetical protein PJI17_32050, partial [Mycobacterium kansasii]